MTEKNQSVKSRSVIMGVIAGGFVFLGSFLINEAITERSLFFSNWEKIANYMLVGGMCAGLGLGFIIRSFLKTDS